MTSDAIALVAFSPDHLEGAVQLSQQTGWPHRLEDWRMALALSKGCVAVALQDLRNAPGAFLPGAEIVRPNEHNALGIRRVGVQADDRNAAGDGRGDGRLKHFWTGHGNKNASWFRAIFETGLNL